MKIFISYIIAALYVAHCIPIPLFEKSMEAVLENFADTPAVVGMAIAAPLTATVGVTIYEKKKIGRENNTTNTATTSSHF